jgi:hypothetical protein
VYEDEGAATPSHATQVQRHPHKKESTMNHGKSTTPVSNPITNATGHSHKHADSLDPLDVLNTIFSILFPPPSTSTTSNVTFKSATPSKASHRTTAHKTTVLKTTSYRHTIHSSASTTHTKDLLPNAKHAVHTQMASISNAAPAGHHTKPSQKAKSHHWKSTSQKKKSKHNNDNDNDHNDDGDSDSDNDGDVIDDGGKKIHRSSAMPSVTMLNALPSLTATAPDPKKSQMESEMVAAERTNKIIGIVVGLGCVAIGSAGLVGYILSRRQDRAQQIALSEGLMQTKWRPQSFLAVVSSAVNRIQTTCSRNNSVKSSANTTNQGMRTSAQADEHGYAV